MTLAEILAGVSALGGSFWGSKLLYEVVMKKMGNNGKNGVKLVELSLARVEPAIQRLENNMSEIHKGRAEAVALVLSSQLELSKAIRDGAETSRQMIRMIETLHEENKDRFREVLGELERMQK